MNTEDGPEIKPSDEQFVFSTDAATLVDTLIQEKQLQSRLHFISLWAVPEWRLKLLSRITEVITSELDGALTSLRANNPEFEKALTSAVAAKLRFRDGLKHEVKGAPNEGEN